MLEFLSVAAICSLIDAYNGIFWWLTTWTAAYYVGTRHRHLFLFSTLWSGINYFLIPWLWWSPITVLTYTYCICLSR